MSSSSGSSEADYPPSGSIPDSTEGKKNWQRSGILYFTISYYG